MVKVRLGFRIKGQVKKCPHNNIRTPPTYLAEPILRNLFTHTFSKVKKSVTYTASHLIKGEMQGYLVEASVFLPLIEPTVSKIVLCKYFKVCRKV